MAKLTREQIMVGAQMVKRGTSIREVAQQLGVSEGALRYHLRKEPERPDGRRGKPTSLDAHAGAVRGILERLECCRVTGEGRPVQARQIFELLSRDYGFTGSYQAVVRHLGRSYPPPPVRAFRRVETPPGVQAQHDWFDVRTRIRGEAVALQALVGVLSHSRARFCWVNRTANQLAWHGGHLALFERYGGVPLWVRIDNLKTGVASGAGATAVLNRSYDRFARSCGFEVDPCRVRMGSDKGKAERSVLTFRRSFQALFREEWSSLEALQAGLDERAQGLLDRLRCPATGTSVREALEVERFVLQPLPPMAEPFDVLVPRRVSRDCLVSFEGRRYSAPFAWVGREVEVLGTLGHVVLRGEGEEIARHPRHTRERIVIDPAHYEGPSTDRVLRPTPLGRRARLQMAGLSGPSRQMVVQLPAPEALARPLDQYARLVEAFK